MKLIFCPLEKIKFNEEVMDLYLQLHKKLQSIYGISRLSASKFCSIFQFGDVGNKKILELGCGSNNSKDCFLGSRTFEPWLLRALHEHRTNPIGIDIGGLEDELFEGYSIDLSKERALDLFQDNSFDIVCAYSFFDAPSVNFCGTSKSTFNKLIPQLERITKSEGYFLLDATGLNLNQNDY